MSKFVEVCKRNGILYQDIGESRCYEPRLINANHIVEVKCREDGKATIVLTNCEVICCKESYEEVKRMVLNE